MITYKTQIEVGALLRRQVRRFLIGIGADFKEEKGILDSVFFVKNIDEHQKYLIWKMVKDLRE